MRKIRQEAVLAFINSKEFKGVNAKVLIFRFEKRLSLNGYRIATFNAWDGLIIQMSGKFYSSYLESLEALNGFEDVDIKVEKDTLWLNGKEWDGKKAQITKGCYMPHLSEYPQYWSTEDGFGKVNMNNGHSKIAPFF